MATPAITLISHHLCPYVQRAAISLAEKAVAFKRIDIDLTNKPEWFLAISPLGKTPVLKIDEHAIFESAVILEYLEETQPNPLHPSDPLTRAEHRSWIEFSSAVLNDIWGFYMAPDVAAFRAKVDALSGDFSQIERRLAEGTYFDGEDFSLVDAAFGPVFRYFDLFDQVADFGVLAGKPKVSVWRNTLAERPSIKAAVGPDYGARLRSFLKGRNSHLSRMMTGAGEPPLG